MADFKVAVESLLLNEGGYVNDPTDPGGETKYGISKRSFPHLDIAALTELDAMNIYRHEFWKFESVADQDVANKLLDMSVQFGLSRAVRFLQNILNVNSDGIFGAITLKGVNLVDSHWLLQELRIASATAYAIAISRNTSLVRYVNGWMRRAIQ